jgi:anthranilate phosphoribosyltransferase
MSKPETLPPADGERMKDYIGKIATGPKQSRDLTEAEAEDGLALVLSGKTSPARAAVFLIAARMKRETLDENIGYWRALDKTTVKHSANLDGLLQVADPFDGFDRTPYFGFYAIPVAAALGMPCYGHSARSLPPKFGVTFQDILHLHYQVPASLSFEAVLRGLEKYRFAFLGLEQSHPALEKLRDLRAQMVKRTALSTFEKMLMPIRARGENHLATGYFHKGYEASMAAVGKLAGFDKIIIGNGMEGTTLYGVHKSARVFVVADKRDAMEITFGLDDKVAPETAQKIRDAWQRLKGEPVRLDTLAAWGEAALRNGTGPAAPLVAWQAGSLCHLAGLFSDARTAFAAAEDVLRRGTCYERLMELIRELSA